MKYLIIEFRDLLLCDHKRSIELAVDAFINRDKKCVPIAYRCLSWDDFYEGKCSKCGDNYQDCAVLFDKSNRNFLRNKNNNSSTSFFIATNDRRPYCGM